MDRENQILVEIIEQAVNKNMGTITRGKCMEYARQILTSLAEGKRQMERIGDVDVDHIIYRVIFIKYQTFWSKFCDWFKKEHALQGERAILDLVTETADAQLAADQKILVAVEAENALQLAEKDKEIAELKERLNKTYCLYCGAEFPLDDDAGTQASEHVKQCQKHPLNQTIAVLKAEVERLKVESAARYEIIRRQLEVNEKLKAEKEEMIPLIDKLFEFTQHADFSNGVESQNMDEGRVRAYEWLKDWEDKWQAFRDKTDAKDIET